MPLTVTPLGGTVSTAPSRLHVVPHEDHAPNLGRRSTLRYKDASFHNPSPNSNEFGYLGEAGASVGVDFPWLKFHIYELGLPNFQATPSEARKR